MDDEMIVRLYWDRNEQAIPATADKYGNYCTSIAENILYSREDAEECVNDTYLRAWNAMPPHRPTVLAAFLGKITRNLSFNRYKQQTANKRGGGETPVVLDELAELVSGGDTVEGELAQKELIEAINAFLSGISTRQRAMFVCRYWYFDSCAAIAARFGMSENNVAVTLSRLRSRLHDYLLERNFAL